MTNPHFSYREQCPACHSGLLKEIYRKPFDESPIREYLQSFYSGGVEMEYLQNAAFHLCECGECRLIFQKEIPGDSLMQVLYEKWIDPEKMFLQHQKNDDLNLHAYYSQEISTIIQFLKQIPSALSFLDFGMGWGKWALMAKAFGCDSYGVEFSEDRIEHAKSKGVKVLHWEDIPNHRFDFINTEQVFEHLSHPLKTLCHLKDSLNENGILKISVPTANNITTRLKIMNWEAPKGTKLSLNPVAPLEHLNYFRRESMIKMADRAGMKEVVIPMSVQYRFTTNWSGARGIAKNIALPIYRNILKRQNYILLRNP